MRECWHAVIITMGMNIKGTQVVFVLMSKLTWKRELWEYFI